jgi:hypothetical protein
MCRWARWPTTSNKAGIEHSGMSSGTRGSTGRCLPFYWSVSPRTAGCSWPTCCEGTGCLRSAVRLSALSSCGSPVGTGRSCVEFPSHHGIGRGTGDRGPPHSVLIASAASTRQH